MTSFGEVSVKEKMNLADMRNADQRERPELINHRTCFFESFAGCGSGSALAVFHEAGGQGPKTLARFDGTTA